MGDGGQWRFSEEMTPNLVWGRRGPFRWRNHLREKESVPLVSMAVKGGDLTWEKRDAGRCFQPGNDGAVFRADDSVEGWWMGDRCRSGEISREAMGVPGGTTGLGVEVGDGQQGRRVKRSCWLDWLVAMTWWGHGDGHGWGDGKLPLTHPSRTPIKSAPTLTLQGPWPRMWLEKWQTLDTPHIEVLFLGLEMGQEGVRCRDEGLVSWLSLSWWGGWSRARLSSQTPTGEQLQEGKGLWVRWSQGGSRPRPPLVASVGRKG